GYRDNQGMGISEHFEMQFQAPSTAPPQGTTPGSPYSADYLYMTGEGTSDLAQGLWGLMRTYNRAGGAPLSDLAPLPNNKGMGYVMQPSNSSCPAQAPRLPYWIAAVNYPGNGITYNSRDSITNTSPGGALVYVQTGPNFTNIPSTPPSNPLILRAHAGDCIQIYLLNNFQPGPQQIFTTSDTNPPAVCNTIQTNTSNNGNPQPQFKFPQCSPLLFPSARVGLHAQMLAFDVTQNNGANIGLNPVQTLDPGRAPSPNPTYTWYAGNLTPNSNGTVTGTPVELGSLSLLTADPLEHQPYSMIGALIVEPQNSSWTLVNNNTAVADISVYGNVVFREFVVMMQDNLRLNGASAAVNYGTEPMANRFNFAQGGFDQNDISA